LAIKGIGSGGSDFVVEPRVRLLSAPYAYLAQAAASILDSSGGTAIGQVGSGVVFNRSLSAATLSAASGSAGSMTVSNKITFMASGTSSGGGAGFVKVSQGDVRVIAGRHRWTNGLTTFLTEPSPGYSVTRISVGNYRIDFDQPFNGVPAVVATATPLTAGNAYSPAADGVNLVHASWFPGPTVFVSQSTDPAIARSSVNLVLKRKFMYRADQTTWVHFVWGIGISGMLQNDFNALWTQPIWSTLDYEADCDFQFYAAGP
jgi:hypothetical protein